MPTVISGPRRARSFVSPTGAEVVTRVLDFNFAATQGIQVNAVQGFGSAIDANPAPSDTVVAETVAQQSLHLEEGTIEDVPISSAQDADEIDTEVFFLMQLGGSFQVPATAGGGGGGNPPQNVYVPFIKPILVARNITHRGETLLAGVNGLMGVLIFYEYVQFTTSELGLILARRQ